MTPKEFISWIEDKALLVGALLWSAAEFAYDLILYPLQLLLNFVVEIIAVVFSEGEEEDNKK